MPAVLNAANESAVDAFCKGQIEFLRISEVVREVMDECAASHDVTLETVLEADALARERAGHVMTGLGV